MKAFAFSMYRLTQVIFTLFVWGSVAYGGYTLATIVGAL